MGYLNYKLKKKDDSLKVIYLQPIFNDLVAQLVEHITFNDGVLGSSPSQVTKNKKIPH